MITAGLEAPKDTPLVPGTDWTDRLLKKIQGNILKPHARNFTRLVLFWFPESKPDAERRALLREAPDAEDLLKNKLITTAYQQWQDAPARSGVDNRPFYGFGISRWGLKRCAYADDELPTQERTDSTAGFGQSMKENFGQLGDQPSDANPQTPAWEDTYLKGAHGPDGLWLLAHDYETGENSVEAMQTAILDFLGRKHGVTDIVIEKGFAWKDAEEKQREPFGFRDGLSAPVFFAADCEDTPQGRQVPRWVNVPRRQILIEDEHSPHDGGSFLVLRKLEQNVKAFRDFERSIKLDALPEEIRPKAGGALLVGRERDGDPLAPLLADGPDTGPNKFDFDDKEPRCPFHAHIRKANPRRDASAGDLGALFVRRSAVYDPDGLLPKSGTLLPKDAATYPEGEAITADKNVGLLFMGYMRNIGEQFVKMQRSWFADMNFPVAGTNFGDPLLRPLVTPKAWTWSPGAGLPTITATMPADFQPLRPRGGAYFFVPSVTWLRAQGTQSVVAGG